MNVGDVIERVYRDYLLPPAEQPTRFTLVDAVDETAETLTVNAGLLSPEEEDLIGPGTLIEAGSELMLVTATDDPPASLTVRRRMYGTDASPHEAGSLVTLSPEFPRKVVFDAVADSIEALWPELWAVKVVETYADVAPVELPKACEEVLAVRMASGHNWSLAGGWEFLSPHPHAYTGKAIQFPHGGGGAPIHVVYRAATVRPESEDAELADLNVEPGWVKAVAVGAVAQVIANEDIDRVTVEFITQSLANEGFEVGQGAELRNSLLQYQGFLMGPLRRALQARTTTDNVIVHSMF